MTFRELKAMFKARWIRRATARFYKRDPVHAVAHVNGVLDEANRAEYERQPVSLW